jgi:YjjG family noncanonical pyrimidine nucleotidase
MEQAVRAYRGYLFDADNTLFDYDEAERRALDETFHTFLHGVATEEARAAYRLINGRFWDDYEKGTVSLADLKVGRFEELLRALHVSGSDPRQAAFFYLDRLTSKCILLPHARETVTELARRARLCLVTNGIASVQRGRLAASGLEECFTAVLISEELGYSKPDVRFFTHACAALGLPTSDVLCVGVNPVADVAGARAAGIDACWYSPSGREWTGPGPAPLHVASDLLNVVNFRPGSRASG